MQSYNSVTTNEDIAQINIHIYYHDWLVYTLVAIKVIASFCKSTAKATRDQQRTSKIKSFWLSDYVCATGKMISI